MRSRTEMVGMQHIGIFLAVLLLQTACTNARKSYHGIDYDAKAAYFNLEESGVDDYVFALNVDDIGNVYFHMSGPVSHCWLGVGFGSEMKDSFMLIAYPSADGLKTTISPRIATGHREPEFDSSYEIVKVYNDTYAPAANTVTDEGTGTIIAHAVCLNCTRWATGFLDTTTTEQPFIFAVGPNVTFRSDSPDASIPRHALYGKFAMDMRKATNHSGWYGRVPAPNLPHFVFPPNDTAFESANSQPAFDVHFMDNPLPGAHAALMCIAFVLVFPAGALVMQFLKRVLWHAVTQVIGFCLAFAGFVIAASFSRQYNKSRNFSSAHQVIGLIIFAALVIQLGLGLVHHSMYKQSQKPTPFGRIHFFLGPFIIVLGIINGGIGIQFAGNHKLKTPYAVVVAVLVALLIGALCVLLLPKSRRKFKRNPEPKGPTYTPFAQNEDPTYEMREASPGERPSQPYRSKTPQPLEIDTRAIESPAIPAPYAATLPFTPSPTITPITPNSWKREQTYSRPNATYEGT